MQSLSIFSLSGTFKYSRMQSGFSYKSLKRERSFHAVVMEVSGFPLSYIGEGNGNPLQHSCLENPKDRVVWWAAIYGITQSRTQLK